MAEMGDCSGCAGEGADEELDFMSVWGFGTWDGGVEGVGEIGD